MKNTQDVRTFDELSEKYSTWVIKYCSISFDKPLFMIWYRNNDENETEHILSYKNGDIFTVKSLAELKHKLEAEKNNLQIIENINIWTENFNQLKIIESCTYNLNSVTNNLKKNILDITTIENIAEFINLLDDFTNQDKRNNDFQKYIDDKLIKQLWEYYYDFIFWPKFNDKENNESWNRPKINIESKELLPKIDDLIVNFESKIRY